MLASHPPDRALLMILGFLFAAVVVLLGLAGGIAFLFSH